jgi:hypothetical protein
LIDWSNAASVAVSGIVSVFLALGILQMSVIATGYVVSQVNKKQSEKAKAQ